VDCHSGIVNAPNASTASSGAVTTRDAVKNEFGLAWGHKKSGRGAVTVSDCIVCHLEGVYATQAKSATYHGDGYIDLRDPDVQGETRITDVSGTSFRFVKFSTSYAAGSRTSTGHTSNNVDNVLTQKFCLKCHDINGAANTTARSTYGTPTQYMPFGGVNLGANYTVANGAASAGGVVNVDSQLTTTFASVHPVKGPRNKDFPTPARLNAPYNNFTRVGTAGTRTNGVVLNCFDCHNVPGASPLTTRTVAAHGNADTIRGLSQIPSPTGTPAAGTNEVTLCKVCHYQYDTQTSPTHGTGSATGSLQRSEKTNFMRWGCTRCHSSGYFTPPARPKRAQDVHGFDATWPAASTVKQSAFIRNTDTLDSHQPSQIGTTNYTPQCVGMFGDAICDETGPGQGRTETYAPGGTY